ncbi:GNAT family N-acetyltransferase [Brevibacterium yomogidense]|uniref:GNAT family N-acetyltransferase n=1 Tax=Brevibacterium yomogidense TaxID=946573 RepID=UPI0018DF6AD1|nr:GNAT family N-acetyltransferase [Brevibacterium yomogidense]
MRTATVSAATGMKGTAGPKTTDTGRTDDLRVQPLADEHLAHFGDILRSTVEPEHQRFLVDNQHGYLDYLRLVTRFPASFPHHRLRVIAGPDGGPAAFADFRVPPSGAGFLSSLVVFPEFRRRGLSRRLLTAFACEFREATTLSLDVFVDNEAAIGLYTSTGLRPIATEYWLVRDLPEARAGSPLAHPDEPASQGLEIRDLPQVMSMHEAYGFSSFVAAGAESRGRVGLLGAEVVNCFEEAAFTDLDFLSTVARTFPDRRTAFHSTPHRGLAGEPGVRLVNTSVRMELSDLSALRSAHDT